MHSVLGMYFPVLSSYLYRLLVFLIVSFEEQKFAFDDYLQHLICVFDTVWFFTRLNRFCRNAVL